MTAAEHKAASEVLLHASRHTEAQVSDTLNQLLAELPDTDQNAELRETVARLHAEGIGVIGVEWRRQTVNGVQ